MNLESSIIKILTENGTLDKQRQHVFKKMTSQERVQEEVRPIFWSIKPKSYVSQTRRWDNFTNGRWGDITSPSFTLKPDEGFISFTKKQSQAPEAKKKLWGQEVLNVASIANIFTQFVQGTLKKFPFSEGAISLESGLIKDTLVTIN